MDAAHYSRLSKQEWDTAEKEEFTVRRGGRSGWWILWGALETDDGVGGGQNSSQTLRMRISHNAVPNLNRSLVCCLHRKLLILLPPADCGLAQIDHYDGLSYSYPLKHNGSEAVQTLYPLQARDPGLSC